MTAGQQVEPKRGLVALLKEQARLYWTRGEAGRETPAPLVVTLYLAWLLAFLGKLLGSSWDVSWHFKWLRDDLAPPHLLNTAGTGLAILLVVFHTFTGYGADKTTLRLMQWGMGVFIIAAPLDVIKHRVSGLDLTSWSPSHAMLYLGTAIMQAGVVLGWLRFFPRRPLVPLVDWKWVGFLAKRAYAVGLGTLFFFYFENVWFPNGQQEYGVLEIASWDRGAPYAEPSLLTFAANQLGHPVNRDSLLHFALPIPSYVYPVWSLAFCSLVLVVARGLMNGAWSATIVAAAYVAYRCLIWPILVGTSFPPSAVPFFAIFLGLAVDLAYRLRLGAAAVACLGGALLTALGYGALWAQSRVIVAPPLDYRTIPVTLVLLVALWFGVDRLSTRWAKAARV
ncbi:hypothetical protein F0L68_20320 [Solihabitans fulvus]|uniref:Uncharacterized protein n=1 Tax=Solihabitans fulvus TaxID=1892852 RepID=A0A5B2X9D0_9PSEU|nr:hypothetical protein [Solihabitans fulvus]KAA2260077.1 hypothetical protein F0L68_20320 [Solihabitans fulvus]